MTVSWQPDRADLVALLATFGDRTPADVPEQIGSLELAWLVHQVEQRHGVVLDLSDDDLARMGTISSAVTVLRGSLPSQAAGAQPGGGRE
jgi:hypothetical protein